MYTQIYINAKMTVGNRGNRINEETNERWSVVMALMASLFKAWPRVYRGE